MSYTVEGLGLTFQHGENGVSLNLGLKYAPGYTIVLIIGVAAQTQVCPIGNDGIEVYSSHF